MFIFLFKYFLIFLFLLVGTLCYKMCWWSLHTFQIYYIDNWNLKWKPGNMDGLGCPQKMDGSWKDKNFIQVNDCQVLTAGVPFAQSHHVCPVQTLGFISSPNTTACLCVLQNQSFLSIIVQILKFLFGFRIKSFKII